LREKTEYIAYSREDTTSQKAKQIFITPVDK